MTVEENLRLGSFTRADVPEIQRDVAKMLELFPSCASDIARSQPRYRGASSKC